MHNCGSQTNLAQAHTHVCHERRFINNSNMPQTTFAYMLAKKNFFMLKKQWREPKRKSWCVCLFFPIFLAWNCLHFDYIAVCICMCVCRIWNALKAHSLSRHFTVQSFLCSISKSDLCITVKTWSFNNFHHVLSLAFHIPQYEYIHIYDND